jgi:hypothetical protein
MNNKRPFLKRLTPDVNSAGRCVSVASSYTTQPISQPRSSLPPDDWTEVKFDDAGSGWQERAERLFEAAAQVTAAAE